MKKLKQFLAQIKMFLFRYPKTVIGIAFVSFLLFISGVEYLRAHAYLDRVEDYKSSVDVLHLMDVAHKLNREVYSGTSAIYCGFDLNFLIAGVNEAYADKEGEQKSAEALRRQLHELAYDVSPAPGFNSLAQYLPKVREARDTSQDVKESVAELQNLTREDSRATYCQHLINALSKIYFIDDIRTPQGLNALLVGQLENFQVNTDQAQKAFLELNPPEVYRGQHVAINDFLNDFRSDLRGNPNDYVAMSRLMQENYENLNFTLKEIEIRSGDLLSRPEKIALYVSVLD